MCNCKLPKCKKLYLVELFAQYSKFIIDTNHGILMFSFWKCYININKVSCSVHEEASSPYCTHMQLEYYLDNSDPANLVTNGNKKTSFIYGKAIWFLGCSGYVCVLATQGYCRHCIEACLRQHGWSGYFLHNVSLSVPPHTFRHCFATSFNLYLHEPLYRAYLYI